MVVLVVARGHYLGNTVVPAVGARSAPALLSQHKTPDEMVSTYWQVSISSLGRSWDSDLQGDVDALVVVSQDEMVPRTGTTPAPPCAG